MSTIKSTRNRGVRLDPLKVMHLAKKRGMQSTTSFEAGFLRYVNSIDGVYNTTPKKVLQGEKVDKKKAIEMALFLGLSSYDSLLMVEAEHLSCPRKKTWYPECSPLGALLIADYGVVPFHGREEELKHLQTWCAEETRVSTLLLTGTGGIGKTRLAIKQCEQLSANPLWQSGFLSPKPGQKLRESDFDWLRNTQQHIFIVIDDAEPRYEDIVLTLKAALQSKAKIRLLLLARSHSEWWHFLKTFDNEVAQLLLGPATRHKKLKPLYHSVKEKEESYALAAMSFARVLQRDATLVPPINLSEDYFDKVLLLHMQALISVEGISMVLDKIDSENSILTVLLNRERQYWEQQARAKKLSLGVQRMIGSIVARISVLGGLKDRQEASFFLDSISLLQDVTAGEKQIIIDFLYEIYPGKQVFGDDDQITGNYISPIQPDLLGDRLIKEEWDNDVGFYEFCFS
jgi:hypothetical protein